MKGFILAAIGVAVLALLAGSALADENTPAAPPGKCGAMKHPGVCWTEKLNLTPDQRAKVKEILKAAHEQVAAAPDRAAKMKIRRDAFEKIKTTVLTDVQRKKLAERREKCKEHRRAPETPKAPDTPQAPDS
jgi:Spy/CpxP family protein refolding chaperone